MEKKTQPARVSFLSMFESCVVSPMSQVVDQPDHWDLTGGDLTYIAGRLKQLAYQFEQLARTNGRAN